MYVHIHTQLHNKSIFSTSKFNSPRITNEQSLAAPNGVPIMASFLPVKTKADILFLLNTEALTTFLVMLLTKKNGLLFADFL